QPQGFQQQQPPQGFQQQPQQPQGFQQAPFQAEPEVDPFADFLRADEEPRPARSSVNHGDGPEVPRTRQTFNPSTEHYTYAQEYTRSAQRRLDRSQVIYTPTVWALAMIPMVQMIVILLSVSSGVQSVPVAVPIA